MRICWSLSPIRALFAIGLALLVSATASHAAAQNDNKEAIAESAAATDLSACPVHQPDTEIHVTLDMPEPIINHTKTRAELRKYNVSTKSPYGQDSSVHVNGLMRGPVELKTNLTLAWQSNAIQKQNCFWYRTINLSLILKPTIYVAKEVPDGTCYYNAIIEHEMKHVEVDRGLIRDYQNILYDTVENFVQGHGTLDHSPLGDEEFAQKDLMKSLEMAIKDAHHRMREDRIDRQAKIDTLVEYNRVSEQCDATSEAYR